VLSSLSLRTLDHLIEGLVSHLLQRTRFKCVLSLSHTHSHIATLCSSGCENLSRKCFNIFDIFLLPLKDYITNLHSSLFSTPLPPRLFLPIIRLILVF
ncbi:hypothetical protein L9F63_000498, partial [Diploptera punctata]